MNVTHSVPVPTVRLGILLSAVLVVAGCSSGTSDTADEQPESAPSDSSIAQFGHVHGLGVNPADDTLYMATHLGVYRVTEGDAERIADRFQDTMAFTVVGPDHFLASGHPDTREDLPAHLGLIESTDAAATWQPLSLLGEADFHALEAAGDLVYGYNSLAGTLMVTTDRMSWDERARTDILDIAADPSASTTLLATSPDARLLRSADGGRTFDTVPAAPALVLIDGADTGELVGLTADGAVQVSADGGATWSSAGELPGPPQALDAADDRWHVATAEGLYVSTDAGSSWQPIPLGT